MKRKRQRPKTRICVSSKRKYKYNYSTRKKLKYVIPVTTNFSLSLKRVNNSWKLFYGIIKVPSNFPAISRGLNLRSSACINLENHATKYLND